MKFARLEWIAVAVLIGVSIAAMAGAENLDSVSVPGAKIQFSPTRVPPLESSLVYGDPAHGPHGNFIKIPAGYATPVHTHTSGFYGIVVSGVVVNTPVGGTEVPLPAGSYWFQKGGERHVTKCVSSTDCIFFQNQLGAADFHVAQHESKHDSR